jgi:hypothetical protein
MIATSAYIFALVASALWFTMALRYFGFQQFAAAKVMIAKTQRHSPVFPTFAAAVRFLGGMNGALALLSWSLLAIVLLGYDFFTAPAERIVLLIVLAAAHFSQFVFNVPVLKNGGRREETYWDVLSGPMFFIFAMDAAQMTIALGAAIAISLF